MFLVPFSVFSMFCFLCSKLRDSDIPTDDDKEKDEEEAAKRRAEKRAKRATKRASRAFGDTVLTHRIKRMSSFSFVVDCGWIARFGGA
jgi:hypothetical protein